MKHAVSEKTRLDPIKDCIEFDMPVKQIELCACFAAGTLVHAKEGLKPIEAIQVGDWVLSSPNSELPPDGNALGNVCKTYRQVTQVFIEEQPLCKLVVANLASGNKETILATPNHPIWCKGRGWTPVSEMRRAGDVLETFLFGNVVVFRCYQNVDEGTVYNFKVDEFHTYYVGEEGIWVHDQSELKSDHSNSQL